MIALQASVIARAVGGVLVGDDALVTGSVQTDSRLVEPGDVFVAMPGEVTDGHRFVGTAVAAGAALVVCERPTDDDVPHVVVESGLAALQALAAHVVAAVREHCTVVGITGSNGKTTTKNMLQAILERHGETVSPVKSFNNEVGAPMTMLRATSSTRFLVLELGASREGDIASLVRLAMPDVSVVLKVGLAHAGEFGGVERTQRAKHEIVRDLPDTAVAVLNRDDDRVAWMADRTDARVRWFGLDAGADAAPDTVWASGIVSSIDGTSATIHRGADAWPLTLRILGEHHVMNALAALSVADELGVAIPDAIAALESMVRAERWRMELLRPETGVVVINDSYNASPDSMAAALRTLAHVSRTSGARSVAVIGAMTELGETQVEEHDRVGRLVVRLGIERLVVVGEGAKAVHDAAEHESSFGQETTYVETQEQALALLRATLEPGDVVLVKSSLSAGLKDLGDAIGGVA